MLCIMCVLAHPMEFTFALSLSVFIKRERAHHVLRKRANYFLEEMLPGDLERECYEETCSREEAREIFKSQEKTRIFSDLSPCKMSPCENGGICQQYHYSYTCLCPPRFMGRHCENGRHECWYKNGDCWQYCADTPRAMSVTCSCANGYTLNMDGKSCEKAVTEKTLLNTPDSLSHQKNITHNETTGRHNTRNETGGNSTESVTDLTAPDNRTSTANTNDTKTMRELEEDRQRQTGFVFNSLSPLPWFQVLIRSHRGYEICSGSLISNRWVLSAAHCFEAVNPHHVTVGDYDKFRRDQDEQKIAVLKFFSHPHYFAEHYDHDIALLYLRSPVIFNEYARPICLPTPSLGRLLTQEGEIGQVSGWGATRYMGPSSRFLLRVRLPIVKQEDCIASTAKMFTGNMFCAGYRTEVKDSCQGDSGGPFAVAYRQTWYLVGVVSWGEKCASEGKFGVYTRVANYIPWIKETIIDNDGLEDSLIATL
uniref:Uncharacterized protein n=1 Tax=Leptobrachium leishanense TaxID=445787 RepID=A0A8C5MR58_9ANUR